MRYVEDFVEKNKKEFEIKLLKPIKINNEIIKEGATILVFDEEAEGRTLVEKSIKVDNSIIEKGSFVTIRKPMKEMENFVNQDYVDNIDMKPLLEALSKLLKIKVEFESITYNDSFNFPSIQVFSTPIKEKDLGIFSVGIEAVTITASTSEIDEDKNIWWATWSIYYALKEGGSEKINIFSSWYHLDTKTWDFKTI